MRADYDSEADAISITLADPKDSDLPVANDPVHERCNVALVGGVAVDVELLYPALGIDEPLAAAAARHMLDLQQLRAAVRSALEAPDRAVTVEIVEPPR